MKLQGRPDIEALTGFKGRDDLVTSFYLDTDKSRLSKKEIQVSLKNLLATARLQVEAMNAAKDKKESLATDLDRIGAHVTQGLGSLTAPGLAVFSCSRRDFWRPLELPHGPRNRTIFDSTFYVRPLAAIVDRFSRICVLLLSRREARWFEVVLGEIKALESLTSDVPAKIREGGFEGTESRRIERHLEARVHDHYKKIAQTTFDLFKKHDYDWLLLGCEDNHHTDIASHLHTYVKERIKGRVKSRVTDPASKILKEALDVETRVKRAEEEDVVQKLIAELERGGRACSGLKETLHRLNQFEVQSLVVTHNFSRQGRICPTHRYLYVDELQCPVCEKKTEILLDVIDEAIETAFKRRCTVKQIAPPSKLDRYGQIGAFLKYKA